MKTARKPTCCAPSGSLDSNAVDTESFAASHTHLALMHGVRDKISGVKLISVRRPPVVCDGHGRPLLEARESGEEEYDAACGARNATLRQLRGFFEAFTRLTGCRNCPSGSRAHDRAASRCLRRREEKIEQFHAFAVSSCNVQGERR
jgi:hypothetical protein